MASPESLLRASAGGVAFETAFAGSGPYEVRGLYADSMSSAAGEAVDLVDSSPALHQQDPDLASVDQLVTIAAPTVTVPTSKRFASWSRQYLTLVAGADALVGGVAAVVPASISNTLSGQKAVPLLLYFVGLMVWPTAIALCRG